MLILRLYTRVCPVHHSTKAAPEAPERAGVFQGCSVLVEVRKDVGCTDERKGSPKANEPERSYDP